ncbi:helix-turn-helix domain-containing protein [Massilia pinisoli]|uniref:Helix-turn-helix domain-containing protein n=1 Tax=Massilia pinisoli TaxID=1772194 RepID=A0ABT1ZLB3_9BURK|nr:helix-turn-helix domain-containing protein [Massilia pinisoli]MCS0580705.1 helix-turn-helix domain-containing protein [Massilia pinisoli]
MQHFYRKALVAFVFLLIADALIACYCVYRSNPSLSLMPPEQGTTRWHIAPITDVSFGGASTVRILDTARQSLSFDFRVSGTIANPWAWAALMIDRADGKPGLVDLSKYSTISFLAKCQPANSLILNVVTRDASVTKQGVKQTWLPVMTYFSCNERGMPVSLDLTRLTIPGWWYEAEHVDIARRSYKLDHVVKLEFGAGPFSPHETDSHVEISDLALHGRDDRYLIALAVAVVIGWCVFGVWFFRAQSRALIAKVDSRLKKDLTFVAYRHLTVEPFEDKEKAAILRFIASHYEDAGLDLDGVAAGTGANRSKINDVLKTELGMTFNSYLKKLRLTEAARLLTDEAGATVAEIARSVGYANSAYLNKIFKEEYGCSPRQFRTLAARSDVLDEQEPAGQ